MSPLGSITSAGTPSIAARHAEAHGVRDEVPGIIEDEIGCSFLAARMGQPPKIECTQLFVVLHGTSPLDFAFQLDWNLNSDFFVEELSPLGQIIPTWEADLYGCFQATHRTRATACTAALN